MPAMSIAFMTPYEPTINQVILMWCLVPIFSDANGLDASGASDQTRNQAIGFQTITDPGLERNVSRCPRRRTRRDQSLAVTDNRKPASVRLFQQNFRSSNYKQIAPIRSFSHPQKSDHCQRKMVGP